MPSNDTPLYRIHKNMGETNLWHGKREKPWHSGKFMHLHPSRENEPLASNVHNRDSKNIRASNYSIPDSHDFWKYGREIFYLYFQEIQPENTYRWPWNFSQQFLHFEKNFKKYRGKMKFYRFFNRNLVIWNRYHFVDICFVKQMTIIS